MQAMYWSMCFVSCVLLTLCSHKCLHILQLEGYDSKRMLHWCVYVGRYFVSLANLCFVSLTCMLVCLMLLQDYAYAKYVGYLFFVGLEIVFFVQYVREHKKKKLVYTARLARIICVVALLFFGATFLATWFTKEDVLAYLLVGLLPLCTPFLCMGAVYLLVPCEHFINKHYIKQAQMRIAQNKDLQIIGITGSYGKTSVKNILTHILRTTYAVDCTQASYNTPMGICKQINNKGVQGLQFFVLEAGARRVGDIAEICKLFPIKYGIITSIGTAHLESFLSAKNIALCKHELFEGLVDGGFKALEGGCKASLCEHGILVDSAIVVSERTPHGENFASYDHISYSNKGVFFELQIEHNLLKLRAPLLGVHNVKNIALSCMAAYKLGVKVEDIERAVCTLEPVPHRLQLRQVSQDVVVLDDAYNSNLVGACNALDVLAQFEGTKVCVSCGIVEMGQEGCRVNRDLGKKMAKVCDRVYLFGANGKHIRQGLLEEMFDVEKIFFVQDAQSAVAHMSDLQGKRVILFENDTTDNYA